MIAREPNGTILLVEDDEQVRTVVRRILQGHGYTVLAAGCAEDATRLMDEHAPEVDLLLSDVVLPTTNGPELAEHLRSLRPDLKVLFMSGYGQSVLAYSDLSKTQVSMIHKPFTPSALVERIRDVMT
ncbi:MAG TPA: response regulator [Polyangiaceae bacterium]|jgi:DNA-binding NtrC family response regulator|nr:response regulator [Polyangiaceae bacterium]